MYILKNKYIIHITKYKTPTCTKSTKTCTDFQIAVKREFTRHSFIAGPIYT